MKSTFLYRQLFLVLFLALVSITSESATASSSDSPNKDLYNYWSYDPGPDPNTEVGAGYIDIFFDIPNFEGLAQAIPGGVRFRPAFGPTFYRGRTGKNQVKVLVIGQDGTHIAEAAGRTFTGGTGGRVQHVLRHLGIDRSYFFINTFAYTIKGQYSDFAPYLQYNDGKSFLYWRSILNPQSYLLSQDLSSPLVKWRNDLIDHIISSNKDSLKLIITIGGAASDTLATFIRSRGGFVGTWNEEGLSEKLQAVKYDSAWAGGNRYFFYPVDKEGENALLRDGDKVNYKDTSFQNTLKSRAVWDSTLEQLVRLTNGSHENGFYSGAQLGSNLNKVSIEGRKETSSIYGLKLNSGKLYRDIRFISVPHPGRVGAASSATARARITKGLEEDFDKALEKLWSFSSDRIGSYGWWFEIDDERIDKKDTFWGRKSFDYDRAELPLSDFPFGISRALVVDQSWASRVSGKPWAIEFGGRDRARYPDIAMRNAEQGRIRHKELEEHEVVPWEPAVSAFDRGPQKEEYRKLLASSLDFDEIFKPKENHSVREDGMKALNVKNDRKHGAFGHYRGSFDKPQVLILADPKGVDGLYSARALTGVAGQKLQTFMEGLGIEEDYLVIKTVPFDMTGADEKEWKEVLLDTKDWRTNLMNAVMENEKPKMIFTWGKYADSMIENKYIETKGIPVVSLTDGFKKAFNTIKGKGTLGENIYDNTEDDGEIVMTSIPRSHLPYGKQTWVGTSGNRVVRAYGDLEGMHYRIVVPKWVTELYAKVDYEMSSFLFELFTEEEIKFINKTKEVLVENDFSREKSWESWDDMLDASGF